MIVLYQSSRSQKLVLDQYFKSSLSYSGQNSRQFYEYYYLIDQAIKLHTCDVSLNLSLSRLLDPLASLTTNSKGLLFSQKQSPKEFKGLQIQVWIQHLPYQELDQIPTSTLSNGLMKYNVQGSTYYSKLKLPPQQIMTNPGDATCSMCHFAKSDNDLVVMCHMYLFYYFHFSHLWLRL